MTREWYPGFRGATSKGEFVVLRRTDQGFLVQYTSGEWSGKYINMPKETWAQSHEVESLKLSKAKKQDFLDSFYKDYSFEFDSMYNQQERLTGQEPSTESMIEILKNAYPPLFQLALNKFFQKS